MITMPIMIIMPYAMDIIMPFAPQLRAAWQPIQAHGTPFVELGIESRIKE